MRAVVYCRVSTDAQERDGTSLDTQERACLELARARGWTVVDTIRDAASGYNLDRAGIVRLRQLLSQSAMDVLVAYAVDRLSRNQNQIGVVFDELQRGGAKLEFVTEKFEDTAVGRFILAARAFIAEVEREKIAERTMRGKEERARGGRIPQGFGRGCYGYVYNRQTGHRDIEPFQAEVVRRIFHRYAETRSYSKVSNELNDGGIAAFEGGRWYERTIRRLLMNESYTGRLIYLRTKWVPTRSAKTGRTYRRRTDRPESDWIEIEGACPRIIDDALWARVQAILADPARIARRPTPTFYLLRSRTRCGRCGSAVVGQNMTGPSGSFRYYKCRNLYDKRTGHDCDAKYIPAELLERSVWEEIRRVVNQPEVVLQELEQQDRPQIDPAEIKRLTDEIAAIEEREKRLIRLFTLGDMEETFIQAEGADLKRRRILLQGRLDSMKAAACTTVPAVADVEALRQTCTGIGAFLDQAQAEERTLALEALRVAVSVTRQEAVVSGVLPIQPAGLAPADALADDCVQVEGWWT